MLAIEKNDADPKGELALLLRTNGSRGKDMYNTFSFGEGESKDDYDFVVKKFDEFCQPRRNLFNATTIHFGLMPCNTKLYSYSGHSVQSSGQVEANVHVNGHVTPLKFIAIPNGKKLSLVVMTV